ncbi:hypothetical protein PN441_07255 [Spirulina major CS-329]|uniref:hypothetical protein n=1 Tax=Spirulina sp. TaxID=1157 RepID=UPI003F72BEEF|nr:hypothetical protein [Spirulina subsalsa CS-330]MDB9502864.1 hypothetical protein [Spirulina major CS-329]
MSKPKPTGQKPVTLETIVLGVVIGNMVSGLLFFLLATTLTSNGGLSIFLLIIAFAAFAWWAVKRIIDQT